MRDFPDHPAIANALETGYPTERTRLPHCPMCGEECETMYKDRFGAYIGCDVCVKAKNAWEVDLCFPEEDL